MNKAIKKDNKYEVMVTCPECDDPFTFVLDTKQMYPPEFFDCPKCMGPNWVTNILEHEPEICRSAAIWILHNRDLTAKEAWKKCTNAGWMLYVVEEFTSTATEDNRRNKVCDVYYGIALHHDDFEEVWSSGKPYTKEMKKLMAVIRKLFPNPPQSLDKEVKREKPIKKKPKHECECDNDYTCDEHE